MTHQPDSFTLPAPAKLNLMLHIIGRRSDGYHELQTLFQFLDYSDRLTFAPAPDGHLELSAELAGVAPQDNLIMRAARLLQQRTGCRRGAAIRLTKRLPMGGGLGGGSSDAATTLVGLNRLWQLGLGRAQLAEIGLQLGADVPVFVRGYAAWGEGVGERLTPVELPTPWYLVIAPACHVATATVFAHKDLTRNTKAIKIAHALEHGGHNDCEAVVRKLHPEVDEALRWLEQFAQAKMTGTGACVFAAFQSQTEAQAVYSKLPAGWKGFIAQGLNRSPLYDEDAVAIGVAD